MFTIIFHDEAKSELSNLPIPLRAKMVRQLKKLEYDPQQLREPDTKPIGNGLFEIRAKAGDIARGLWVYQAGKKIYMLGIFVKKTSKTPPEEITLAWARLKEMKNDG
ncbi:type II toxin-antitoxin system RelE/ParE family toxin [Salmonella enterica]|nr:type II toxin-antitoxin system RelE/ParE family toxin [Salmonella enterica]